MEPTVGIKIRLEGDDETHSLTSIPISFDELASAIYGVTGASNFKIKYQGTLINSTKDMVLSYLENQSDTLEYEVDEDIQMGGYLGANFDRYMMPKSSQEQPRPSVNEQGVAIKETLLLIIAEMGSESKVRLLDSNREFMEKRQEVYGVNEEKWREIAFQQLQFQEKLIMNITGEVCKRHAINPEIFQKSCAFYNQDPVVAQALEDLATKTMEPEGDVPSGLTKEKLRELLFSTCDFLERHLKEHPPTHPADFILLKIREGDEVKKQFGFNEFEVAAALAHYAFDKAEEWNDVRDRLGGVMKNALGFDPMAGSG